MGQKTITKIDALPQLKKRLRVAAYARVSSGKDAMLHSLAAQVSYYNKMITEHEGWEFAGVYADEALSGTKDTRDEFKRLIQDAKAGKIDLIIVKAISRFARNTLTMLETVRELKAIGVDVFFEEQNLHTLSAEGEMVLTFLASFAQEEARSVSENMKWRIKRDFEKGIIWGGQSTYGYRLVDKKFIICQEEAEVVKRVFDMYINGCGVQMIANILDKEGVRTMKNGRWSKSTVQNIISNYNYTGGLVLQKTFREDYITKKTKRNKGQFTQYIVDEDHEPIVSLEDFMLVQEIRNKRHELCQNIHPISQVNTYTGMIRCANCGSNYERKNRSGKKIWQCYTYGRRGKEYCHSKAIREDILDSLTLEVTGLTELNNEKLKEVVDFIEAFDGNKLVYHFSDGTAKEMEWKDISRRDAWTPEMKEAARAKSLMQNKKEEK